MNDYTKYVTAVNKIFECVNKMKTSWTNVDNLNYLEKIEEYKDLVIEKSKIIKEDAGKQVPNDNLVVEELGQ